jgi:O-antigen ligase
MLLTLLVAEAAFGSSGRWVLIGPLSIRNMVLGACLVAGLPLVWRERRHVLGQSIVWVTSLLVLTLAGSALWAYHLGNARTFIVNDLTTFSALLLVPTVVALRLSADEVARLVTVLFASATALAAATLAIHVLIPWGILDPSATADWLFDRSLGGLADVGGELYRIYFRSQIIFIPALLIGLQRAAVAPRHRMIWLVGSSVLATGLVVSLSRSLWIGVVVAVVVAVVLCSRDILALLRAALLVAVGAAVLVSFSTAVYGGPDLVNAAVDRLDSSKIVVAPGSEDDSFSDLSDEDAEAVGSRSATLELTRAKIRERPLTGWGIGYNLDSIRDDGRTEYMYWDMLMKLGFIGMVPFLLTFAWLPLVIVRRGGLFGFASDARALAAGLTGVAVASYFNPFLNSTLGIAVLLLLVAATDASTDSERQRSGHDGGPSQESLLPATAPPE